MPPKIINNHWGHFYGGKEKMNIFFGLGYGSGFMEQGSMICELFSIFFADDCFHSSKADPAFA